MKTKYLIQILLFILISALLFNCAEKPITELNDAETSVRQAKLANAEKYAPEQLQSAQKSLKTGKQLLQNKLFFSKCFAT